MKNFTLVSGSKKLDGNNQNEYGSVIKELVPYKLCDYFLTLKDSSAQNNISEDTA